jgi:hypothetical protein
VTPPPTPPTASTTTTTTVGAGGPGGAAPPAGPIQGQGANQQNVRKLGPGRGLRLGWWRHEHGWRR